jgi:hypothetical protein
MIPGLLGLPMKRLSNLRSHLGLTVAAGVVSSSGLLLYEFAQRRTLDLTSVEGLVGTVLWVAWVSLPYVFFGCVGRLFIRAGSIAAPVVTAIGFTGVLVGAAVYGYWVFVQPGMMSGLVFVGWPALVLMGYAGLFAAVLLVKLARRIIGR